MRKSITLTIALIFISCITFAQPNAANLSIDSLKHQLVTAKNDSSRVLILADLCNAYKVYDFDSVAVYAKRGLALAQKGGYSRGEIRVLYAWQDALENHGDIPESLELNFKALQIAEEKHYAAETALGFDNIGNDYWDLQDYPRAISYYKKALLLNKTAPNSSDSKFVHINSELSIGDSYSEMNMLDSAFFYVERTYKETLNDDFHRTVLLYLGDVLFKMDKHQTAFAYLRQSVMLNEKNNDDYNSADACKTIARFFKETNQPDSAIFYAKKGLAHAQALGFKMDILINSKILADEYEHRDIKQAFYYLKLAMTVNDQLFGSKRVKDLQKILSDEQQRQRETELKRIARQDLLKEYMFLTGLAILLLIAFILYRHNKQKQKANRVLESTLINLKATQTQLIQSEKMASLGELTAGIAHEIQNPLNFVNNFSDVNREMIDELKAELKGGNIDEALAIADDIGQNEDKINHHGKRADNIVKGMLEHSRTRSGQKEPTDLNMMADEFMRLSYHGLRAKDKSFNAELITHFDSNLPKVAVVQQDIGRVLLNLFNNAFYAVNEKKKTAGADYKPEVAVTTSAENGKVIIKVKDNGNGIPDAIKDKIMQPFFTTKPTCEGTGLGLSLTYDMVVKGHGGSIQIYSVEGEGSEFIINLPL
jgi:two-component system NtrC family sensor kinase